MPLLHYDEITNGRGLKWLTIFRGFVFVSNMPIQHKDRTKGHKMFSFTKDAIFETKYRTTKII